MKKRIEEIAVIAFLISLFGIATELYLYGEVDYQRHQRRIHQVITVQQTVSLLITRLLMVENDEMSHFDSVAELEVKLEQLQKQLAHEEAQLDELREHINDFLILVSQIKSSYVVYRNSSLFFPKGTLLLRQQLLAQKETELADAIMQLERKVLLFVVDFAQQEQKDALLREIQLIELKGRHLSEPLHDDFQRLLNHAQVLIRYAGKLQDLNKKLLDNSIIKITDQVLLVYEADFQHDIDKAAWVKKWFYISIFILIVSVIVFWRQLRQALKKQQSLNRSLEFQKRALDEHSIVSITDVDGNITYVNDQFCRATGYSKEELIGNNHRIIKAEDYSQTQIKSMWDTIVQGKVWHGDVKNKAKQGHYFWVRTTVVPMLGQDNKPIQYIAIRTDITENITQQNMLEKMAHYDVLTGLPNRVLVADRFKQARSHCKRSGTKLAICFLDLDDFKPINDNYGHEAGDKLLLEIANRIQSHLREDDTVARLGGDEFVLILNDVASFEQCKQTLERIQNAVSSPVMINHQSCQVSMSIGVTLYPNDNSDFDTLLRHADKAMYQAKLAGKHCYALFNPERDLQTIEKNQRLTAIRQALETQHFQLYYQPKVSMVTGAVFGVEALIRWIHPDKGVIPPLDFLPIVEKTELEITIGNWVIEQALKQLDEWNKHAIKLEMSVNIASYHLLGETFCTDLEAILAKYPTVDSKYLQLEILETSALEDVRRIDSIIEICQKNLGVKVALDDFGTGYSSLTHLRCLSADTIKIDQSFVRDMLDDPSDSAIVEGVIGLASAFNRELIAEGVETEEHGLMLLMMGCKKVQGYGVAKPMSSEAVLSWLEDYQPNSRWVQYASRPRSILESKIDLFKLVAHYWMKKCLYKIESMHEMSGSMSVMANKACPLENWINQIKQQQLFPDKKLQQLEKAYKKLLQIRDEVYVCYQKSEYKQLETKAEALKTVFEDMIQIVDQMLESGLHPK